MFSLKVDDDLELGFYTERNAEEVYRVVKENYEHLYRWSPWLDEGYSIERAKLFANYSIKQFANRESMPVCIICKNEIVGGTGFGTINWDYKTTEIGYWLAKKHEGKGIVTKCCRKLLDYAFDELGLNRIVLKCVPENHKSRAIPERLGFVNEGVERQGGFHHGEFVDFVIYSMLAKDWK
jgi:ribosomal-protein-serine acetyltransferase